MNNMSKSDELQIEVVPYDSYRAPETEYDLNRIIFNLDSEIDLLSDKGDQLDCLLSAASGILCGMLDVLWVGEFSLARGRDYASNEIDGFVTKMARLLGCKDTDVKSAVKFLENKFPIPSDGNEPDFGGGPQHHLRDFAHHPTAVGLAFSLLTQFTEKSYGTDGNGIFLIVDIPEGSKIFIGKDIPSKVLFGTITWFFHLVSDLAGSDKTVGKSGGTGIPGPLLALAKELSVLPLFQNMKGGNNSLPAFLSKLFNGKWSVKRDEGGAIIRDSVLKIDLRGELGAGMELGRQAIPVAANDCIVRAFFFIRCFAMEVRAKKCVSLADLDLLDWRKTAPVNNPTIARMLIIASGMFMAVDISDAIVSQKYWVSVNYIGVGRFAIAVGEDVSCGLKARNLTKIKQMYEQIQHSVYDKVDNNIYKRVGKDLDIDKLGLTVEQTEILYNLEYYKTLNDIRITKLPINDQGIKDLKQAWLDEWKKYITGGFASFLGVEGVELHWYTEQELLEKIGKNEPRQTWFRLVLLEAMLFTPYYPLGLEKNKKGQEEPSKKYKSLQSPLAGYKKAEGDAFFDSFFKQDYYSKGYVKRLRKCYDKMLRELNEVLKAVITTVSITAGVIIVVIATAGALAPSIAVALVGSSFSGLSGAALTSACLAYLGGGAIAAGGLGMAGGTAAIVGGGAVLGLGVGAGVGGAVGAAGMLGKKNTIAQSAKLMTTVREIFLNDEHDVDYSNSIYECYLQNIREIEKGLVDLKLKADVASGEEKKKLQAEIKSAEDSVEAMKIARKSLLKFKSSFDLGLGQE